MSRTYRFKRGREFLDSLKKKKDWLANWWYDEKDYQKDYEQCSKYLYDRNKPYGETKTVFERTGKRKQRNQERILTQKIMKDPELYDEIHFLTKHEVVNPWDYS